MDTLCFHCLTIIQCSFQWVYLPGPCLNLWPKDWRQSRTFVMRPTTEWCRQENIEPCCTIDRVECDSVTYMQYIECVQNQSIIKSRCQWISLISSPLTSDTLLPDQWAHDEPGMFQESRWGVCFLVTPGGRKENEQRKPPFLVFLFSFFFRLSFFLELITLNSIKMQRHSFDLFLFCMCLWS